MTVITALSRGVRNTHDNSERRRNPTSQTRTSEPMAYQLKYRGQAFTYQPAMPTEAVRKVRSRGRTTLLSSAQVVTAPTEDVQFFGWHAAGSACCWAAFA